LAPYKSKTGLGGVLSAAFNEGEMARLIEMNIKMHQRYC